MKKLKNLLKYNYFFHILFLISLVYTFININYLKRYSFYDIDTTKIKGYINDYNIDGDKLSLIINAKEKIIVNYYFKSEKEKNDFSLSYGDYISIIGENSIPSENSNFNTFNYRKYLYTKKINYVFNASEINFIKENNSILYKIKNNIINRINKINTNDYIKTFILGNKKEIETDVFSSYQFLGVSHLLAISGMHVSLLSSILLKLLYKFNDKFKYLIISVFLLLYLFITNYAVSMIRASFQFILFGINKIFSLNISSVNIVLFLISILLIYNPYYVYDVGFLFSFSISFSLILHQKQLKDIKGYFNKTLIISLVSFLVSLPVLINNFYQVNFLSIIYNVFYVPFVSFIIFPLNLLTLLFPFLDNINSFFINIFEDITLFLSNIKVFSFSCAKVHIILIIIYYINLYFLVKNKSVKGKYTIFLILFLILFINNKRFVSTSEITFIDVGQGDSAIIRIHDKNILIDTGGKVSFKTEKWKIGKNNYSITKSITIPYLKSIGVKKLDYMILTHGDFDHMGEAINLVNNFKVENVIFNCGTYNDLENELINVLDKKNIKYYSCIKELNIDNNKLHFLNSKEYDNENDNSNVIYTELNNYKFLFMGDAGIEKEKDILNNYNLKDIDFLKVGHHGSRTSSSKEFINKINPKCSIISVGKNNRYEHPNKEVLDNLKDSKIYRTDVDGSIMFKIKNNKLKIETCTP